MGKGDLYRVVDELFTGRKRAKRTRRKKKEIIMPDDMVKVTETTKEYELLKTDLVTDRGGDEPTWYNKQQEF